METNGYQQICAAHQQLTNVRFQLLAMVPAVSGAAIGLISTDMAAFENSPLPRMIVALMGFLVTLGIVIYDQRNNQIYNALYHRGAQLEKDLGFAGPFSLKPGRSLQLLFLVKIWHDRGLALIYGAVLGAWIFPIACGLLWSTSNLSNVPLVSAITACVGGVIFILEFHRLDRQAGQKPKQRDQA